MIDRSNLFKLTKMILLIWLKVQLLRPFRRFYRPIRPARIRAKP